MKTMTIKEIASLCEVDERTVRRWVEQASDKLPELSDKMSEAFKTKKLANLSLSETIAIIRAGGKNTLADLLAENAKKVEAPKAVRLPNGTQLRELRLMADKKYLSPYQVQLVLGVAVPRPETIPEIPATKAEADAAFAAMKRLYGRPGLPAGTVEKVARAAAGAARSTLKNIEAKAIADASQPRLIGDAGAQS